MLGGLLGTVDGEGLFWTIEVVKGLTLGAADEIGVDEGSLELVGDLFPPGSWPEPRGEYRALMISVASDLS